MSDFSGPKGKCPQCGAWFAMDDGPCDCVQTPLCDLCGVELFDEEDAYPIDDGLYCYDCSIEIKAEKRREAMVQKVNETILWREPEHRKKGAGFYLHSIQWLEEQRALMGDARLLDSLEATLRAIQEVSDDG